MIVLVISDHSAPLYNIISYNIYERLLGLDQTPWSQRQLAQRLANKKAGTEARSKAGGDRVPNTKPSHALGDYLAEYENPAYGILKSRIGGVDRYLESIGRATLITRADDLDRLALEKASGLSPLASNRDLVEELIDTVLRRPGDLIADSNRNLQR